MAIGSTAGTILTEKILVLEFDTGETKNEKPVLKKVRYPVKNDSTLQQVYDSAYAMAAYSKMALYGIQLTVQEQLGPID